MLSAIKYLYRVVEKHTRGLSSGEKATKRLLSRTEGPILEISQMADGASRSMQTWTSVCWLEEVAYQIDADAGLAKKRGCSAVLFGLSVKVDHEILQQINHESASEAAWVWERQWCRRHRDPCRMAQMFVSRKSW